MIKLGRASNSDVCTKCTKDKEHKEYFQIQCTDFNKYLKCQSKCVTSAGKNSYRCFKNHTCLKKCELSCKKLWPGRY